MAQFDPKLIREVRKKLGMSQEEFADYLGVITVTVNRWETGKCVPRPRILHEILEIAKQNKFYAIKKAVAPVIEEYHQQSETNVDVMTYRLSRRLTQTELAQELGVSLRTIQRWEKSKSKMFKFYMDKVKEFRESHKEHNLKLLEL